jgi:hypothetical protein
MCRRNLILYMCRPAFFRPPARAREPAAASAASRMGRPAFFRPPARAREPTAASAASRMGRPKRDTARNGGQTELG